MDYPKEVFELSAFFPDISSREEAEKKVRENYEGKGTYLLRPSSVGDCQHISLSISETKSRIHHIRINIEDHGNRSTVFYVAASVPFASMGQLLDFYSQFEIHVRENVNDLKLLHPVCRSQTWFPVRKDSLNSLGDELSASEGSGDSNPSAKDGKSVDYLELKTEDEQYLHTLQAPLASQSTTSLNPTTSKRLTLSPLSQMKIKEKPKTSMKSKIFSKTRSASVTQAPSFPQKFPRKKTKSFSQISQMDLMHDFVDDTRHHCRPPAPLPSRNVPESDDIIYSYVNPEHDFFEETYQLLKKSDLCECGVCLVDAELPNGWVVHYSKEEATMDFVFFQSGDITMWDVPEEIVSLLSKKQRDFIVKLCHKRPCPIPRTLKQYIEAEFMKKNSMSSSPLPSPPARKGSVTSSMSVVKLSSSPSSEATSKNFRFEAPKREQTVEVRTIEKDDDGCYEKAGEIFNPKAPKNTSQRKSLPARTKVSQDRPQPALRKSTFSQNSNSQNPYVLEDATTSQLEVGLDPAQSGYNKRGQMKRILAFTSSSNPSLSSCDFSGSPGQGGKSELLPPESAVRDTALNGRINSRQPTPGSSHTLPRASNAANRGIIAQPGQGEVIGLTDPRLREQSHQQRQEQRPVSQQPPQPAVRSSVRSVQAVQSGNMRQQHQQQHQQQQPVIMEVVTPAQSSQAAGVQQYCLQSVQLVQPVQQQHPVLQEPRLLSLSGQGHFHVVGHSRRSHSLEGRQVFLREIPSQIQRSRSFQVQGSGSLHDAGQEPFQEGSQIRILQVQGSMPFQVQGHHTLHDTRHEHTQKPSETHSQVQRSVLVQGERNGSTQHVALQGPIQTATQGQRSMPDHGQGCQTFNKEGENSTQWQ